MQFGSPAETWSNPAEQRGQSMQSGGEGWYLLQRLSRVDTVDWEPPGLPWDLVGHMLTSYHSLSRAPESEGACRTKERSHQQREAIHHWPTWETLDDTFIGCRHQGMRPAKHMGARLPRDASSHSVAGSSSCRQIQAPSQCKTQETSLWEQMWPPLHAPNHCLKTAENLGWKLEQSSPKTGLTRDTLNYWLALRFEVDCVFSYFLLT